MKSMNVTDGQSHIMWGLYIMFHSYK